jgi:hypothetical protein
MSIMIDKDLINQNIDRLSQVDQKVLWNILRESVPVYLFIRGEYLKGSVTSNHVFQFVFRSFYRLDNAGLSPEQKTQYFKSLSNNQPDVKTILLALYNLETLKKKKSIQLSFATKLIHTINNDQPIYDKYVSSFTGIKYYNEPTKDIEYKILKAQEKYDELCTIYKDVFLINAKLLALVSDFRTEFRIEKSKISDVKVIDFLIWAYGSEISE